MGKHHGYTPSPPSTPEPTPVPNTAPPVPFTTPPASASAPQGGNGMVWCSGPQAPGWNVSLPNGGCSTSVAASKPTVVHLSQLPYTNGDNPYDMMLSAMFYLVVVAVAGGFAYKLAMKIRL